MFPKIDHSREVCVKHHAKIPMNDLLFEQFPYFTCALKEVQNLREQKYFKTKCVFAEGLN